MPTAVGEKTGSCNLRAINRVYGILYEAENGTEHDDIGGAVSSCAREVPVSFPNCWYVGAKKPPSFLVNVTRLLFSPWGKGGQQSDRLVVIGTLPGKWILDKAKGMNRPENVTWPPYHEKPLMFCILGGSTISCILTVSIYWSSGPNTNLVRVCVWGQSFQ